MRDNWRWGVLSILLLAALAAALTFDRSQWPYLVGDEATYAMQAASLAWDLDLSYSRQDYDRFLEQWNRSPDGLILQSRNGGRSLAFGKPSLYAVAIAPLVRLAPVRGAPIANALFLTAAALLAAVSLSRQLGQAAPLWVAAFLFAAVPFGYLFWVHADLFLMTATASAFALAYWSQRPSNGELPEIYHGAPDPMAGRTLWRFLAVGALAAVPGSFRPFYLTLLVPLVLAARSASPRRPQLAMGAVLAGALAVLLLSTALQWQSGGSWTGYAGERQDYYPERGYPDVDFPRQEWSTTLERWGNKSWIHEESFDFHFDASLWGWNLVYFLVGRSTGVLPYFLPLVLGFVAYRSDHGRWAILPTVLLTLAATFLLSPFNFYGGAGALGNRYFLPLYPALWFLAGRPSRSRWAVIAALAASPFLWPLWTHPRAFPVDDQGRYVYVSSLAEGWLPFETSQSHIPGGRDVRHNDLWLRFLNSQVGPLEGGQRLELEAGAPGELLVASPEPLESVWLESYGYPSTEVEVSGAELGSTLLRPDGSDAQELLLTRPRARHPMWWTWEPLYLYQMKLSLRGATASVPFVLTREMPTRPGARP